MALDIRGHNPSCPEHCPGQPGTSGTSEITPNPEFTAFPVPLGMIAGIKCSEAAFSFCLVHVWESTSLMVYVLQNTSQMLPVAFLLPA